MNAFTYLRIYFLPIFRWSCVSKNSSREKSTRKKRNNRIRNLLWKCIALSQMTECARHTDKAQSRKYRSKIEKKETKRSFEFQLETEEWKWNEMFFSWNCSRNANDKNAQAIRWTRATWRVANATQWQTNRIKSRTSQTLSRAKSNKCQRKKKTKSKSMSLTRGQTTLAMTSDSTTSKANCWKWQKGNERWQQHRTKMNPNKTKFSLFSVEIENVCK